MKKLQWAALCLLAAAAIPAHANTIAISGSFSGSATLTGGPTIFTESFSGNGTDTTFGSFTGSEQATVNVANPSNFVLSNGTFNWVFAQGTLAGTFSGSGDPATGISINFLITSGFLAGDSGQGTASEVFSPTGPNTANVSGTYSGTIDTIGTLVIGPNGNELVAPTPIPAALPLFASGAGVIGLFARRRKRKAALAAA